MIDKKLKVLFVCTINRMRSATAHVIYKDDNRLEVQSAGTDASAATVISQDLLQWAEAVVVMEKYHRNFIRKVYPDSYRNKKSCVFIFRTISTICNRN